MRTETPLLLVVREKIQISGAVRAFIRKDGVWSQQGSKFVGSGAIGAAEQGQPLALSADGNTALVGGSTDNGGVGAVWVFSRSGSTWSQQGSKLVPSDATGNARFGFGLGLSADGNIAVIGGNQDSGNGATTGAAWIFTRQNALWSQQGAKLVGTGAAGGAGQGYGLAISADGSTVLIGGQYDNNATGAMWVFVRSGNSWIQQGAKIVPSDATTYSFSSNSLALSADGNTAISSGAGYNGNVGAVWIFTRSQTIWNQLGLRLTPSDNVGSSYMGQTVSCSADGLTIPSGGSADNSGAGAFWIFSKSGGTYSQQGSKITETENIGNATLAQDIAISSDSSTIIVGGRSDNSGVGAAWIYSP